MENLKGISNQLIELIKSQQKYEDWDVEDLNFIKLNGNEPEPGSIVQIFWNDDPDDEFCDIGYLFDLPGMSAPGECDIFVHIPKPQNPSGMDTPPPVFLHLFDLLTNVKCERIKVSNNQNLIR